MISHTIHHFWQLYHALPADVQNEADKAFTLFERDPFHPGLQFKELRGHPGYWSARWFWIGPHTEYEQVIGRLP